MTKNLFAPTRPVSEKRSEHCKRAKLQRCAKWIRVTNSVASSVNSTMNRVLYYEAVQTLFVYLFGLLKDIFFNSFHSSLYQKTFWFISEILLFLQVPSGVSNLVSHLPVTMLRAWWIMAMKEIDAKKVCIVFSYLP